MNPIGRITVGCALAAGGAAFLPQEVRCATWSALAAAQLTLTAWGVVSMRSGLFGRAYCRGDGSQPQVALTFDDGPDPVATPALLDLLRARGVRATFFVVGERALAHPSIVARCHAEGHLIGNHSQRHSNWTNFLHGAAMRREIEACQRTVLSITGVAPRHYRPPIGLMNPAVAPACRTLGLQLVGWTVRGLDTGPRTPSQIASRILKRALPGAILLLHDGARSRHTVVEATTRILDGLAADTQAVLIA